MLGGKLRPPPTAAGTRGHQTAPTPDTKRWIDLDEQGIGELAATSLADAVEVLTSRSPVESLVQNATNAGNLSSNIDWRCSQ
jgi:hypothetical protein